MKELSVKLHWVIVISKCFCYFINIDTKEMPFVYKQCTAVIIAVEDAFA